MIFILFWGLIQKRFLCLMGFYYLFDITMWNAKFYFVERVLVTLPFIFAWALLPFIAAILWKNKLAIQDSKLHPLLYFVTAIAIASIFVNHFLNDFAALLIALFSFFIRNREVDNVI